MKELRFTQEELREQIIGINGEWEILKRILSELLRQFNGHGKRGNLFTQVHQIKSNKLSGENDTLNSKDLSDESHLNTTIAEIALGTFAFLGQLFANIVTIGLYGVYMQLQP